MGDVLQGASVLLLLYGSWESGSQRTRAYIAKLAGNCCVFAVGITYGVWGNCLIAAVLGAMQVRAMVKWRCAGMVW